MATGLASNTFARARAYAARADPAAIKHPSRTRVYARVDLDLSSSTQRFVRERVRADTIARP